MKEGRNERLPHFLCLSHHASPSLDLFLPVSVCAFLSHSPTPLPAFAPPAGQSQLAPRPHPQFPGASLPSLAPSRSDQQPQPGKGVGPSYNDLPKTVPFAPAAAVSAGRGCGEGAPEAMSRRLEMGIKLGCLWGSDQEAQSGRVSAPCSPLETPATPGLAVPQGEKNRFRLLPPIKATCGALQSAGHTAGTAKRKPHPRVGGWLLLTS